MAFARTSTGIWTRHTWTATELPISILHGKKDNTVSLFLELCTSILIIYDLMRILEQNGIEDIEPIETWSEKKWM